MDGKTTKLEQLGAFGIVGESFRILHRSPKLFGAITITLVLPLSLAVLLHNLISLPLSLQLLSDELNLLTGEDVYDARALRESHRQLTLFLMMETVFAVIVCASSLVLNAAMAYAVACVYIGKNEPSFAWVMKVVPRLWKRMLITFLWVLGFLILNILAFAFAVCFLIWGFNYFNISSAGTFNAALIVTCVVFVRVWVYIVMLWKLASVVSILEEKYYGLEGLKKSHCLLNGKDITALVLTLLHLTINSGFCCAVVSGNWDLVSLEESSAYGTILLMLECAVTLMGPLTQSVLYFVCKSYHDECIHKWWVLELFGGYPAEYLPVKTTDILSKQIGG
ncbi:hypothetical protein KI387_005221 [Taxus chinensis]|uniref:Uncharacterized protein n=1 Tax=Taxus chinensis TaxID=29808 RepID=A0AA38GN04_TAXCH|nr:hypothetical protein KI387_005221 [Taxus chinensis]